MPATESIKPRSRRVLVFVAEWCVNCRPIKMKDKPWLEASRWQVDATERAHVQLIDIDQRPELAKRYGVTTIPELILIDGDKVVERTGYHGRMTAVELMLGKPVASVPKVIR